MLLVIHGLELTLFPTCFITLVGFSNILLTSRTSLKTQVHFTILCYKWPIKFTKLCFKSIIAEVFVVSEIVGRDFIAGSFFKVFNNPKLWKVFKDISSYITWFTVMLAVVCQYVVNQSGWFFCDFCQKRYMRNEIVR